LAAKAPVRKKVCVHDKLYLCPTSRLEEDFGVTQENANAFLRKLGVPIITISGVFWYNPAALEDILSQVSAVGGDGVGQQGRLGYQRAVSGETNEVVYLKRR